MFAQKFATLLLVGVMLTLGGCFGRGDADEEANPESAQAVVTATDTPPAASEAPAPAADQAAVDAVMNFSTVEEAAEIQSYRMRITMNSTSARGNDQVEISGEYVKEPPAEKLTMQFEQSGELQVMEILLVDGVRYVQVDEMWMAAPDMAPDIQELTLLTPADMQEVHSGFAQVGVETVNGRQTVHYRGDKETIPTVGTAGDTLDVSEVEDAQIDLWVDQAAHFLVKMQLSVQEAADSTAQLTFEYYDFNADIVIVKPDNVMSMPGMGQVAVDTESPSTEAGQESASTSALGQLLGFDLMMPTGSSTSLLGSNMAQLSTPYTAEEAVNLFSQTMPANGYTLMSQLNPEAGQTVLMYQKGVKIITINITATESGSELQIISAP